MTDSKLPLDERIRVGDTYSPDQRDCDMWVAGIYIGVHGNAIECYGDTQEIAEQRRDAVLAALRAQTEAQPVAWLWIRSDGAMRATKTSTPPNFETWAIEPIPVFTRPATAAQIVEMCARVCDKKLLRFTCDCGVPCDCWSVGAGIRACAAAIRALSPAPQSVVVPVEPTEAMLDAPRYFILYCETPGRTFEDARKHMQFAGHDIDCWPEWAKTRTGHITKSAVAAIVWAMMLSAAIDEANNNMTAGTL